LIAIHLVVLRKALVNWNLLVAVGPEASSQLHIAHCIVLREEALFRKAPGRAHGREVAEAVLVAKAAGAIGPDAGLQ
nr:hypothetical protein [Tanacetum cinerariifolium]